jgi:hypothetical protein
MTVSLLGGCPGVPDIYFVSDAGGDAEPSDGGGGDVATPDAGDATPGTCQGSAPANSICCGTNWCFDCQATVHCAECSRTCGTQMCCGKGGGNVVCKATCP